MARGKSGRLSYMTVLPEFFDTFESSTEIYVMENRIFYIPVAWILFTLLILVSLLQQSCDKIKYSPTGVSEMAIAEPPSPKDVWVTDKTLEADTLKIWGSKNIHYHFTSNKPIAAVRVLLNDKELHINNGGNQGYFTFHSREYTNGLYYLTFQILLKTESGSLASALNSEFYLVVKKIPMRIVNYDPIPLKITSVQPEDGTLRIRWEKYPFENFQKYSIYINGKKIVEIDEREKTYCDFKEYLGGNKKLRIHVYLHANDSWKTGPDFEYSHPYKLTLQDIELNGLDNKPVLRWNKCPFYQNLISYQIKFSFEQTYDTNNIYAELFPASETTYTGSPVYFGRTYYFHVVAVSSNKSYSLKSNIKATYLGESTKPFVRLHYIAATEALYFNPADFYGIMVNGKFYRMNPMTLQPEAQFSKQECTFAISDDGSVIFAHAPFSRFEKRTVFRLNPMNLSIESTFSMDSTVLNDDEWPTMESIVYIDPNALLFRVTNGKIAKLVKYNYQTGNTIVKAYSTTNNYGPHIRARSYLGKYLLIQLNQSFIIYDVSGDQFVAKNTIDDPDYFCFGSHGNTYITTHRPNLTIYSCETGEVIKEIPIGHSIRYPNIDPVSGYLGGCVDAWGKYYYTIYDLNTGERKYYFRLAGAAKYRLANNMLFYPSGRVLRLSGY